MPISYTVNERLNFVYTIFSGCVDRSDIEAQLERISKDRRIRPGYLEIVDYRNAEKIVLSSDELFSILYIEETIEPLKSSKMAAVTDSKSQYGIGRMYQTIAENNRPNVKVFTSLADALKWLGLEESDIVKE